MKSCNLKTIAEMVEDAHMLDGSMSAGAFVQIELLFCLAEHVCRPPIETKNLHRLLMRSDIVTDKTMTSENYYLMKAKGKLRKMSQYKAYNDALEQYKMLPAKCRAYDFDRDGHLIIRPEGDFSPYETRKFDYVNFLTASAEEKSPQSTAKEGLRYTYRVGDAQREVTFETLYPRKTKSKTKPSGLAPSVCPTTGGPLTVTTEEILAAAEQMDDIFAKEGKKPYRKKLLENHFYAVESEPDLHLTPATEMSIEGVINLEGQVSSGKSTFADALTLALTKKGGRVLLLCSKVEDIIEKAEMLEKLGVSTSCMIGKTSRLDHLKNQLRNRDCLTPFADNLLGQVCLLNVQASSEGETILYGKEPCKRFYRIVEGEDENGQKTKEVISTPCVCAYYDICKVLENERRLTTAQVLLTTPQGFVSCSFGRESRRFMNYAIQNMDLVIADEAEMLACTIDDAFAPSIALNHYIQDCENLLNRYMNLSLNKKRDSLPEEKRFYQLLPDLNTTMVSVYSEITMKTSGWPDSCLRHFSAYSLLERLNPENGEADCLDEEAWAAFYAMLNPDLNSERQSIIDTILRAGSAEPNFSLLISRVYDIYAVEKELARKILSLSLMRQQIRKLGFILRVTALEQIYREMSYLALELPNVPPELRQFLTRSYYEQQAILPNSPLGNSFALEMREGEIYLIKQFALGRSALLNMPRLLLDSTGHECGASVLLMSGTGYLPGSFKNHLGDHVAYILEAEPYKRDFIARTKAYNPHYVTRVSGAPEEEKGQRIRKLLQEMEDTLVAMFEGKEKQETENILFIVNSYKQAETAEEELNRIFQKHDLNVVAARLARGIEAEDADEWAVTEEQTAELTKLHRKDVSRFRGKALVAPASVIARGYNIVGEDGNAWFDTVVFLVRPLLSPTDYSRMIQSVNGAVVTELQNTGGTDRLANADSIRKRAFELAGKYNLPVHALSQLSPEMKIDTVAELLLTINQVFGRLCRIGEKVKDRELKIYFADGAFNAGENSKFDTLEELRTYLKNIMENSANPLVARTLYEPFYQALERSK